MCVYVCVRKKLMGGLGVIYVDAFQSTNQPNFIAKFPNALKKNV
jgi:hypothetical protein